MTDPTTEREAPPPAAWPNSASALGDLICGALVGIAAIGVLADGPDSIREMTLLGCGGVLGVLSALLWRGRARDPARRAKVRLAAWSTIRFFLAFEMTRYGMAKIVGMQFYRRFYLLDARVIELTPMNLAWSFFGHSYGYQAIAGGVEIVGAVLLCFRRTTTLGACVVLTALANVLLVNVFFDVTVKLYASVFLAMTLWLLTLEAHRFVAFFVTDRPVPPRVYLAPAPAAGRSWTALRWIAVALVLGGPTLDTLVKARRHRLFLREPLLGAWHVDAIAGLDDLGPVEGARWTKVYFEKGGYGSFRTATNRVRFHAQLDAQDELWITLSDARCPTSFSGKLDLTGHVIHLAGTRDGHPFSLDLTREFPR